MKGASRPRVTVLGGGFGGLEAARYARMRLPGADITLVSDRDYFLFKPNTIYVPFGMDPGKLMIRLAGPTKRENIRFVQSRVREIDPVSRRISLEDRSTVSSMPYDFLVIATGLHMRPDQIPGLSEFANMRWTLEDLVVLRTRLQKLAEEARAGKRRNILFVVSPYNRYSGPLYEMVMLLDTWLRRKHARDHIEIAFSTYENSYIQSFGPGLHEVVTSEFRTREIAGYTNCSIEYIEPGKAFYRSGEALPYDLLITFPPCTASTYFKGLPVDDRGFIATELATRQVIGYPDVYAVGDASNTPKKQALTAFLQAGVAAEHLSASILGIRPTLTFDQAEITRAESPGKATFGQFQSRQFRADRKPCGNRF